MASSVPCRARKLAIAAEFGTNNVPLLSLHDGFYTTINQEGKLRAAMRRAYEQVIGRPMPDEGINAKVRPEKGHLPTAS